LNRVTGDYAEWDVDTTNDLERAVDQGLIARGEDGTMHVSLLRDTEFMALGQLSGFTDAYQEAWSYTRERLAYSERGQAGINATFLILDVITIGQALSMLGIGRAAMRLMSNRIPATGVAGFDALMAVRGAESPIYRRWVNSLERRGWRVRPGTYAGDVAAVFPESRVVQLDRGSFTYIDLIHEERHILQVERAIRQGVLQPRHRTTIAVGRQWEVEAYELELRVARRQGFSQEYIEFLQERIEFYSNPDPVP